MGTRMARYGVLIGLAIVTLTGCGRQVARTLEGTDDLLATGPDQLALAAARPDYTLGALEATGGVSAWMECRRIDFSGVVSAYRPDGSYYMSEHTFIAHPWSEALLVSAHEPGSDYLWRLVGGKFEQVEGNARVDISPLAGAYQDYATALLEITTAPVRLMEEKTELTRRPLPVQMLGQVYTAIDAEFAGSRSHWTNATYFASRFNSRVELIWLANPARRDFLIVRGHDYIQVANGVFVPSVVEIYHSDGQARLGSRFATINIAQ